MSRRLLRLPFPFSAPTVPGGVEAPPPAARAPTTTPPGPAATPPAGPGRHRRDGRPPGRRRPGPARAPRPRPADPAGRGRRPGRLRRQPPQPRRHAAAGHVDPRAVAPQAVRGRGGRLLPDAGHQRPVRPGARRHPDRGGRPLVGRPGRGPALRRLVDAHLPRGRAQPHGWGQPFRGGAAYLAVRCGVPVVPVHIDGTGRILRKGRKLPKPATAQVTFGPAVPGPGRRQPPVRRTSSAPSPPWPTRPPPTGGRPRRAHAGESPALVGPDAPRGAGRGRSATPTGGAPGSVAAGPSSSRGPGRPAAAVPPGTRGRGSDREAAAAPTRPLLVEDRDGHDLVGRAVEPHRPRVAEGCTADIERDPSASSTDIQ